MRKVECGKMANKEEKKLSGPLKLFHNNMYLILFLILVLLMGCSRISKKPIVVVNQVSINKNSLEIIYEINNHTPERLWFCDDIEINLPANETASIHGDTISIEKRLSSLPEEMEFNPSVIARYVLIEPRVQRPFSINISISDNFWSFDKYDVCSLTFKEIKRINLSVGYVDSNMCRAYLTLRGDPNNIYDRELPEFIEKMHVDKMYPKDLYVLYTWKPIYTEKTVDISILTEEK